MQWDDVLPAVRDLIAEQQLPEDFLAVCQRFYFPLARYLLSRKQMHPMPRDGQIDARRPVAVHT
jgi:hypothetical protein